MNTTQKISYTNTVLYMNILEILPNASDSTGGEEMFLNMQRIP